MLKRLKNLASSGSKNKNANEPVVALDIGTENIKALVAIPGEKQMKIVGVGRASQGHSDMQAGAIADISAVVENCDKALREAEEQSGERAAKVVVGVAGELIKGITNSLVIARADAEKPLDHEELDDIVKRVQADAYNTAKEEISLEMGPRDIELKLVNSALVSVNIDGYKVTNPIGFQGSQVEVQLYTAFAPLVHIGAVERVVRDLDLELIAVAAEPFAVARSVVGDNQDSGLNAILIDVGGGTTDIAVIKDGGLEGTQMFGIGGRSFTKTIMRDQNIDFDEAEGLKLALSEEGILSEKEVKEVEIALTRTVDVWIQGVHLALSEFDWLDYLPHQILLCGGGSSLELLRNKLKESSWYDDLPMTKKPVVKFISTKEVIGMEDTTGKIKDHTMITVMGLARVGNDTLGFQTHDQFKGKIAKALEN